MRISGGPTACACSTGRCRITAARSASSSAPKPRRTSVARSGSCTCTRTCVLRRPWRTWARPIDFSWRCARRTRSAFVPSCRAPACARQTATTPARTPRSKTGIRPVSTTSAWRTARCTLDGGWRVYSSGAGIALGLIVRHFLGLGVEHDAISVDPVIPASLDGLRVRTTVLGRAIEIRYRIRSAGRGVTAIALNDQPLSFTTAPNPHRRGAAVVPKAAFVSGLTGRADVLTIDME